MQNYKNLLIWNYQYNVLKPPKKVFQVTI